MLPMANSRVPLGFRFYPTDQEIILFFLYRMVVERKPLMPPYNKFVLEEDLVGAKEPWEIWEDHGGDQLHGQDLYFFCRLKPKGSHFDRKIGRGGTWSEGEPSKLVYDENGNPNPIGRKRKLRYENPGSEHHAGWYLDEYSLFAGDDEKASKNHCTYDLNFVICRLRRNERSSVNKRKRSSSQDDQSKKMKPTNKKVKTNHELGLSIGSLNTRHGINIIDDDVKEEQQLAYGFDPISSDDSSTSTTTIDIDAYLFAS